MAYHDMATTQTSESFHQRTVGIPSASHPSMSQPWSADAFTFCGPDK